MISCLEFGRLLFIVQSSLVVVGFKERTGPCGKGTIRVLLGQKNRAKMCAVNFDSSYGMMDAILNGKPGYGSHGRLLPPQLSVIKVVAKDAYIFIINIGNDLFGCLRKILLVFLFYALCFI